MVSVRGVPILSTPPTPAAGWRPWLLPLIAMLLTAFLLFESDACKHYEQNHLGDKVPKRGMGRVPPY